MDFSLKDYLPDSGKRIERLKKIVRARPVVILAAGPSIAELEQRISELRDQDICYFGFNNFFVQEKNILTKIGKRMEVTMCSGREGVPEAMPGIIDFLNRDENNMFISSYYRDAFGLMGKDFDLGDFIRRYDRKLMFFGLSDKRNVPNKEKPLHFIHSNSLLVLVQMAMIGGASKIVMFGADGGHAPDKARFYYRHAEYSNPELENIHESILNETHYCCNNIGARAMNNTRKNYGLKNIDVLNCSINSLYTPFPAISYDYAVRYLVGDGKFDRREDKRRMSVIIDNGWKTFRLRVHIIRIGIMKLIYKLLGIKKGKY
ncbi:MAG: hypothetical protein WC527_06890 [Candidatus Margulisiibacteriota bacterium]